MKSRILLIVGLGLLLVAGVLVALASSQRTKAKIESQTITTNGQTITITKVTPLPGQPGSAKTTTVVRRIGGRVRTVSVPGATTTVNGPTRVVTNTQTVRPAPRLVTGPTRTVTTVQTRTQTVNHTETVARTQTVVAQGATQTIIVPGPSVTVTQTIVETVTVKGNGNCPPKNPHCP